MSELVGNITELVDICKNQNIMRKTTIYMLICPITLECRYIGKSVDPLKRYQKHIQNGMKEGPKRHVYSWINGLLQKQLLPEMVVIDEVEDWVFWESFYIEYFKSIGCKLTNLTIGGEGSIGYKHTEKWKQDMSLKAKGRKPWNTGKTLSKEHKDKIAKGNKGRKFSKESKEKIGSANAKAHQDKSKLSEEDILFIKSKPMTQTKLALKYGVSQSHICRIQKGEVWGNI